MSFLLRYIHILPLSIIIIIVNGISTSSFTKIKLIKEYHTDSDDFIQILTANCNHAGTDSDISVAFRGKNGAFTHFFKLDTDRDDFEPGADEKYYFRKGYASEIDEVQSVYIYYERHGIFPAWMPKKFITYIHRKEKVFQLSTYDANNCSAYINDKSRYFIEEGYYRIYNNDNANNMAKIQYFGDNIPSEIEDFWDKRF